MIWKDCVHLCMHTVRHSSFDVHRLTKIFSALSFSPPFFFPESGLVYGRLIGITKYTMRTDVLNLLEQCNLTLEDVKVDYNRNYLPVSM